ncbi:MAG TPA: hypothetical protein C5S37_03645 [Methanophagales archaeon]|nr:hypothetical protein [Methanophagales archaeon]
MRDKGVCKILTILVAFMMVVSCAAMPSAGGVSESEVNVANPDNTTSTELNENPKFAFSSYYQPINISVNLSVPPYNCP